MSHKFKEGYSGKNPVPTVALRSLIDPSGATEAKAKHLRGRDKKEENEQNETEKTTSQMAKGKEVRVRDPVTGEETVSYCYNYKCYLLAVSKLMYVRLDSQTWRRGRGRSRHTKQRKKCAQHGLSSSK